MTRFALLTVVMLSVGAQTAAVKNGEAADLGGFTTPFLRAYCVDCHGPDESKAGLRLDTLGSRVADEGDFATWVRVHDKVAAGEMPPRDSDSPPKPQVNDFVKRLRDELHAASRARQNENGRVPLRRLNATEYENTLRELVGAAVGVKEMLPEENSVAGFDNVSSGLDFSATHQLLFQEAAEKAVRAAVPQYPQIPYTERRTGKVISQHGPNFRQTLNHSCRIDGESLLIYSKLPRYGLCCLSAVPAAGVYRVRMSVAAVGAAEKPFPVGFYILSAGSPGQQTLFECRDIPHGEPRVLELEVELGRHESFVLNLLTKWDIRTFKRPLEEYNGPGVRVDWLEIEGPVGAFPPASYAKLFGDLPLQARSVAKAERNGSRVPSVANRKNIDHWVNDPLEPVSANPKVDAERLIRAFAERAFRGPAPEELTRQYVSRVQQKLDEDYSFFDAMVFGYKSILSSPHFLTFDEPGRGAVVTDGRLRSPRLDDYAVANRLAYFLWSSPPDEELLTVAARGELKQPDVLRRQVERLLDDGRSRRFTENFTGQWLDLRKIDSTIPDPHLYGDFDGLLFWSMLQESYLVFEEILKHDRSLLEFVDADWSMLNERLASHYGIPDLAGSELRKVALPAGCHRGGVLTQASILKVTADGTRTSPILRGKWVLEKIVGRPPAPPPPDVPTIEPDIRGATTIREQLEKHRASAACASCHRHIDPPGFALEAFDPIGGYRDFYRSTVGNHKTVIKVSFSTGGRGIYRGPNVDPADQLHDGRSFRNIDDYKKLLLADPDQLARNLTEKLLIYSTGADIQFADREVVEQIVDRLKAKDYGFRALIHEVVASRVFLNK